MYPLQAVGGVFGEDWEYFKVFISELVEMTSGKMVFWSLEDHLIETNSKKHPKVIQNRKLILVEWQLIVNQDKNKIHNHFMIKIMHSMLNVLLQETI